MRLIDIVIAFLYRLLDTNIYIEILEGFKMFEPYKLKDHNMCLIKLK